MVGIVGHLDDVSPRIEDPVHQAPVGHQKCSGMAKGSLCHDHVTFADASTICPRHLPVGAGGNAIKLTPSGALELRASP